MNILKIAKDAQKAYQNIAKLEIRGNVLVIVNIVTGCLHYFVDGRKEINLTKAQIQELNKLL